MLPELRYDLRGGARDFVWIHTTIYPVRDATGAVDHVALMQEDITAQKGRRRVE